MVETRYKKYIERWKTGLESGMRGKTSLNQYIRRYIFDKTGEKCWRCAWSQRNQFTKKVPLEINHIDGNFKNNSEDNLELICPNCHALTKTYRSGNKGNGRPYIRGRIK